MFAGALVETLVVEIASLLVGVLVGADVGVPPRTKSALPPESHPLQPTISPRPQYPTYDYIATRRHTLSTPSNTGCTAGVRDLPVHTPAVSDGVPILTVCQQVHQLVLL